MAVAVQTVIQAALRAGALGRIGRAGRPLRSGANIGIRVQSNLRGAAVDIERLVQDHNWVQARALTLTAQRAATETRRELSRRKNVPQKVLARRVKAYKASPRKRPIRSAVWIGTKKPITASELVGEVSVTRSGYVKVGRRIYKSAFPARMPGGHRGIFTRKPGAKHKRRPDGQMTQLPIEEALVQLLPEAREISRRAATRHLKETFPKEVRRLMTKRVQQRRF